MPSMGSTTQVMHEALSSASDARAMASITKVVTALVVLRRTSGWYLPLLDGVLVAAWAFTAARDYTIPNIMELVVGEPLSQILRENGHLTPDRTLDFVCQAAKALAAATGTLRASTGEVAL